MLLTPSLSLRPEELRYSRLLYLYLYLCGKTGMLFCPNLLYRSKELRLSPLLRPCGRGAGGEGASSRRRLQATRVQFCHPRGGVKRQQPGHQFPVSL